MVNVIDPDCACGLMIGSQWNQNRHFCEEKMPHVYVEGLGLSNVRERCVLYGADFRLEIESHTGQGTVIRIDIPELVSTMQAVGQI